MRLHCGLSDSKAGKASQQLGAFEIDQGDNGASEFKNQEAGWREPALGQAERELTEAGPACFLVTPEHQAASGGAGRQCRPCSLH